MGDNGVSDVGDRPDKMIDVVACETPRSPWKTSATASPITDADSESWPVLSDAQKKSKCNGVGLNSAKSPPLPAQAGSDGCGDSPTHFAAVTIEPQKLHGRGNFKSPRRPYTTHHNKNGPKHAPNNIPSFAVPLPYHPPTIISDFHTKIPVSPPADLNIHNSRSGGRKHSTNEQYGQTIHLRNNQLPASNNFYMQQNVGPRPFIRPPFFGPCYVNGPNYPGPPGAIYCYPAAPPGAVRVPYPSILVPYPVAPAFPVPPTPIMALRASIVKQIEYYFSEENLKKDAYLISLMDNHGWVQISIIAGFNMVKRMNVDIPFILDALQTSQIIEVQGEMVRRRNEWSKWIPKSLNTECASNDDDHKESTRDSPDGTTELLPSSRSSRDSVLFAPDTKDSINTCTKQSKYTEEQRVDLGMSNSSIDLAYQPNSGNNINVLSNESNSPITVLGADSVKSVSGNKKLQSLSNPKVKNFGDSSDDISSTFMLDEELERDQKMTGHDCPYTAGRVNDDDEEIMINEAVERLVIVTQNSPVGADEESKTLSNEVASAINDGLYFYEQELNSKRSQRRHNKPTSESRDENSRNSAEGVAIMNSRILDHSTGKNSPDGPGSPKSRRKQNKGNLKQHQRLFYGNIKGHGSGRGAVSESPPSDAVGFFFGSTPPDSNGFKHSKLSASPQRNLSESSPQVGSVPKSFPPFRHPSHKLLEENGFKQQLYNKYKKRCLADRKKRGIGYSEEMNTLYRFWCFFLRNMFVPSMYEEFCKLAIEDAAAGYNYGMQCLFRFYSYGLEKEFRDDLYDDFEQHTLQFYKKGSLYGMEKYWAFHHFREARGEGEPLRKHPELDRLLREEYCSMEDFKRAKAKNPAVEQDNH